MIIKNKKERNLLHDMMKQLDVRTLDDELDLAFLDAISIRALFQELERIFSSSKIIEEELTYFKNIFNE